VEAKKGKIALKKYKIEKAETMPISTHIMRCSCRGKVPIWALNKVALGSGKF